MEEEVNVKLEKEIEDNKTEEDNKRQEEIEDNKTEKDNKRQEEIEEMMEKVKDILEDTDDGLNKDSIAVVILLNNEIDTLQTIIDAIKSGEVWAEYEGDRESDNMNIDQFTIHDSEKYPLNKEIFKIKPKSQKMEQNFDILINKIPQLLCLQNFLEAGMTDEDAIDLFKKYFPEANISIDDCDFIREKADQYIDPEIEKALEKTSREIINIMKKDWENITLKYKKN